MSGTELFPDALPVVVEQEEVMRAIPEEREKEEWLEMNPVIQTQTQAAEDIDDWWRKLGPYSNPVTVVR